MSDLILTCSMCNRERTIYNPLQEVTGRPLGWYSRGDGGEVCPECMTRAIRG